MRILIDIDDVTAKELDLLAPAKSRLRSRFIREAIRRAIRDELERRTEAAYRRMPQSEEEWGGDPATWEQPNPWESTSAPDEVAR